VGRVLRTSNCAINHRSGCKTRRGEVSEAKQRYSGSGNRSGIEMGWDGHAMCCWMGGLYLYHITSMTQKSELYCAASL
jgi:hypothetical protein